jgi:hypothetical protein
VARDLPGPLRGGTAGASEGQAGRHRSRAQEDLCRAAPGGQSHGGIAPQRRQGHQRRRTAQRSLGNPGAQTGVSAIAHRAAMLPLADGRDGTVYLALDPLCVGAFNTADGCMRDVIADIAREVRFRGAGGRVRARPSPCQWRRCRTASAPPRARDEASRGHTARWCTCAALSRHRRFGRGR